MGLFNKHKKFPKYSKGAGSISNLPKYEAQMPEEGDSRYYEMPDKERTNFSRMENEDARTSKMPEMRAEYERPSFKPSPEEPDFELPTRLPGKIELREPMKVPLSEPVRESVERSYNPVGNYGNVGSEPIYVKLDDYKKAVKSIALIRDKIEEADELIGKIVQLKKEEDQQLNEWHREITEIKNKLMEVDRTLFEVDR